MIVCLIILLLIFLFLLTRIWIKVRYEEDKLSVNLQIGLIRFAVFPEKKSKKITEKKNGNERKEKKVTATNIRELLPLLPQTIPVLEKILLRFRRKLEINQLTLRLVCAADDPGDAALMYGYANAGLALVMSQVERFFTIKKRDLQLSLSYEVSKIDVLAYVVVSMTIGQCIALCVFSAVQVYGIFKFYKKEKGGVSYESSN